MHSAQQLTIIGSRHELFSGYQAITQQKNRAAKQSRVGPNGNGRARHEKQWRAERKI
jgi:hypothetical protein